MPSLNRLSNIIHALRQLGTRQVGLYAYYQFLLRSGVLRWQTHAKTRQLPGANLAKWTPEPLLEMPNRADLERRLDEGGIARLSSEADEIVGGKVRLFGADPLPLQLSIRGKIHHWTEYERGRANPFQDPAAPAADIKFIWEPGRFGWALSLGRAYRFTQDERYPQAFWRYFEEFESANPPYFGPHWMSAQEVAIRLIGLVFAAQVFAPSRHSTPDRIARIGAAIVEHAARIPPTIAYAQSQNNNHLLIEAAGLFTAGLALPGLPKAQRWRKQGWELFQCGLQSQISPAGVYIQHSTNYQRLMLQIALWMKTMGEYTSRFEPQGGVTRFDFPLESQTLLAAATRWLQALIDEDSGCVPNLGPNDGANLFPLCDFPFQDYRPTLQAAALAWLEGPVFPPGPWDELASWIGGRQGKLVDRKVGIWVDRNREINANRSSEKENLRISAVNRDKHAIPTTTQEPPVLRSPKGSSWAYFRVANFTSRPGHADQLHLDLWWRGLNVAQDAGTYLYNAPPPWDNGLSHTDVHNTITLDRLDQMTHAGRFLWLDWAQGEWVSADRADDGTWERRIAHHDGYRKIGVIHQRTVTAHKGDRWTIEDRLFLPGKQEPKAIDPAPQKPHTARLHWLLPDWPWELDMDSAAGFQVRFLSPYGWINLRMTTSSGGTISTGENQIVRAGISLLGQLPASPTWGCVSPTYGVKVPALSVIRIMTGPLPLFLTSEWEFPIEK